MIRPSYACLLGVMLPLLAGCHKKAVPADDAAVTADAGPLASASGSAAPKAAPPRVATVKPFVPSFPVPPFKGAFPHPADVDVADPGRTVEITYARAGGEGDVAPLFTLTNKSGKKIRVNQTWLFYYDAAGKQLNRYPHSLGGSLTLEPGESKEQRLGVNIKDIKPGTVTYEGEVTSAYFGDDPWFNENLYDDRPQGGPSPDDLIAKSGERVIVDVYDLATYKVRLTNVTDKPVSEVDVSLLYFNAKGRVEKRVWTRSGKATLKPGESADMTLEPSFTSDKKPPPKVVSVVGFARRVEFADRTRFENKNLDSEARRAPAPAKTKAK